jgi:hypothetical protein
MSKIPFWGGRGEQGERVWLYSLGWPQNHHPPARFPSTKKEVFLQRKIGIVYTYK